MDAARVVTEVHNVEVRRNGAVDHLVNETMHQAISPRTILAGDGYLMVSTLDLVASPPAMALVFPAAIAPFCVPPDPIEHVFVQHVRMVVELRTMHTYVE